MMDDDIQIPDREYEISSGVIVKLYNDGSGFHFKDHWCQKNGEYGFGIGLDQMQALIATYNQFREELKNAGQLSITCRTIEKIKLKEYTGVA